VNLAAPALSSDLAARFLGPAAQSKFESTHALRLAAPSSTVPWSLFSTARPERTDLTVRASSFDHAREFLGSMTQPNRKRLNLATPAPSHRLRRKVFGPCGSIQHRAPASLAVHAPLRPSIGVRSPQPDRIVEHWGLAALYVLIRLRHEVFEASRPAESKAPRSVDPCTLFSTSPQSFWALRFDRTSSAHEPCGSRTSSPAP
jgi:hypothetical protein